MALAILRGSKCLLYSSIGTHISTKSSAKWLVAYRGWRAAPYATQAKMVERNDKLSLENNTTTSAINPTSLAVEESERTPYWQKIPRWHDVEEKDFLRYSWQVSAVTESFLMPRS